MDNLRIEELRKLWNSETEFPDTQDWRDDLTPEELDYVSGLDKNYRHGILAMASAILVRKKVRQRFSPSEIQELETIHDHCRLRLKDGQMFLAWLDQHHNLRLDEIDGVC